MSYTVHSRITDLISGLRAGQVTLREAADRLEAILALASHRPVEDLALEAVHAIEGDFYDHDDASRVHGTETATCPECGEDIPNLSESCPYCGARFPEPVSHNQQVFDHALRVITETIHQALFGHNGGRVC